MPLDLYLKAKQSQTTFLNSMHIWVNLWQFESLPVLLDSFFQGSMTLTPNLVTCSSCISDMTAVVASREMVFQKSGYIDLRIYIS